MLWAETLGKFYAPGTDTPALTLNLIAVTADSLAWSLHIREPLYESQVPVPAIRNALIRVKIQDHPVATDTDSARNLKNSRR